MSHKKATFLLFSFLIIIACHNTKKEKNAPTENKESRQAKNDTLKGLQKGCYVYNTNRSTISLQVMKLKDSVSGTLLFALAEKDKNTGRFTGKVTGNILLADYTFESEGIKSVRQVAFKIKNDTLLQGYGPTEMKDTVQVFKNPNALTFNKEFPLVKRECVQ